MTSSEIKRHNSTVLTQLEEGDLVEFNRGPYSHWGVYIGNEEIVHLSGDENDGINGQVGLTHFFTISGVRFNKAKVVKENFWKVTADSKAKKNNGKDRKCTPLSPDEVVEKALSMMGEIGYNVLWNNCEHFAAFCRYGQKWSEQADKFLSWVAGITFGVAAISIGYGLTRPAKDKEKPRKS